MGADWQTIGREILTAARNELYLKLDRSAGRAAPLMQKTYDL